MKAAQYAEAVFLASQNKDDADLERVSANVVRVLTEARHLSLMPTIIQELVKLQKTRQSGSGACVVRVASAGDVDQYRSEIDAAIQKLDAKELHIEVSVDDTVIGGYAVTAKGKRIDRTHKRSLVTLYDRLITNL